MKKIFILLILILSLGIVNAVDYDNLTFTNEEFFNGAVTATKVIELSTNKLAVGYTKSSDSNSYFKICDLDGTNCGSEIQVNNAMTSNGLDVFEDTNNNRIIFVTGRTSSSRYVSFNLTGGDKQIEAVFDTGNTNYVSAVQINSTHFAIAYQDTTTSSYAKLIVCKLDGSSCGSETTVRSASSTYNKIELASDNKLKYFTSSSGLRLYDISSPYTSIPSSTVIDSGTTSYIDAIEGSDNKLKIVYRDQSNSNYGTFISCDLDGTNCGSEVIIRNSAASELKIVEFEEKLFTTTGSGAQIVNFNLSGGELSQASLFDSTGWWGYNDMIVSSDNNLIISYDGDTNTAGKFAISEALTVAGTINTNLQTYYNSTDITVEVNTSTTGNLSYIVKENYLTSEPDCPLYPTVPCIPDFADKLEFTAWTNQNSSNVTLNLSDIITLIDGSYGVKWIFNDGETNLTQNFTIDTTNPNLTVTLPSEYNAYSDFNFSSYINVSDTNLDTCIVEVVGESNTTCTSTDFDFTTSGNKTINVYATDLAGNTNNSLNNLMLVNPYASFYIQDSLNVSITDFTLGGRSDNSTGLVQYLYYGDGLVIGSNTLEFEKIGYITQNINFNISTTAPEFNQTYTVSDAVINVFIKDRETGSLVTGTNFTLEFIATVGLVTSTTTGTASVTNLLFQEEEYQLVATNNANYTTESIFFTFSNKESLDVTIYVQDSSLDNYGVVDVKVVDKFGKAIQGAIVQALQWNTNTSSFIKVSEGLTAENGKSLLNIILDTKLYIFNAQFGDLTKNTSQQFIPTLLNGKEITISLDEGATEETGLFENIQYTITESFDNNTYTSNISFSWNNKDGTDVTGCIKYFRVQPSGTKTELSEDCSTGSVVSDLSVSKLLNSSYYIFAEVGFEQSSGFYVLKTFKYNPILDISNVLKQTNLALYILPFLYLVVILIGMLNPFAGAAGLIVVNILGLYLVPQYLNGTVVAFMYFIAAIIMYAGGRRK